MKIKRFFSLFFCALLCVGLTTPAWAVSGGKITGDVGDLDVEAKAALLIDPETEEILLARDIHERRYPASLTKIMTCLLVLESIENGDVTLDTVMTASQTAIDAVPDDASTANIQPGEQLTVENLLYCTMLSSANEGCNVLAEGLNGSIAAFVERMNDKAAALGCEDTHFVNPNGLPDVEHYTTAWDLYLITKEARTYEAFMPLVNTIYYEVPATNLSDARKLYTTNYLLSSYRTDYYIYKYAAGIKTGSTNDAGFCLISSATRDGRSLLSVVLGAERITLEDGTRVTQSFTETRKMFEWGFDNFTRQTLLSQGELVAEVPVELSQQQNSVKVCPANPVERLLPNDVAVEDVERKIEYISESVDAPVAKGQVLGTITLQYGGIVYAVEDLLADEDVSASRILIFRRNLIEFLHRPIVWAAAGGVAFLLLLLIILRLFARSRQRRYGTHGRGYRGRKR